MLSDFPDGAEPLTEQAAWWLFELADRPADDTLRRAFLAWLKRSPRHIEEFLAVAALEQELPRQQGGVDAIVAEAKRAAARGAVPIGGDGARAAEARRPPRKRSAWRWLGASAAAAALVVLAVAIATLSVDREHGPLLHETDYGEQRAVLLPDGSAVTLNTRSTLSVQFDKSTRRVFLLQGQAMFDVVADPERPFVVETGDVAVSVLGTRFSVYRRVDGVELVVVEGTVGAESRRAPGRQVLVQAGEGALATPEGTIRRRPAIDLAKALAWTEQRLIFEEAALAEVVAEFNRYNRLPLVVEDDDLAERSITTVFNAADASTLVGFLELQPDIEVEREADAIRIRVKR